MQRLMLFTIVVFSSIVSRSAELLNGYIVMTNNDTVKCDIRSDDFLGVRITAINLYMDSIK
ncbi:MAG: hypothetical protein JWP69_1732 [Flaviaesturariibacter sp.]|nr:hypothetical protein [Flaviaesturariibacter sp.]